MNDTGEPTANDNADQPHHHIESKLHHEANEDRVEEIHQCLCPNCNGPNASTTMHSTTIPFFREICIMTLICPDCNFRNSETIFGGAIKEKGEKITLTVHFPDDLNRQIVKSESAEIKIPYLDDFEISRRTQVGVFTLEGLLKNASINLESQQSERLLLGEVDNFHRCRRVISKLRTLLGESEQIGEESSCDELANEQTKRITPFTLILDDPAGNSFIEIPNAPLPDPNMTLEKYFRTPTQDMIVGLQPSRDATEVGTIDDSIPSHKNIVNVSRDSHSIEFDDRIIVNQTADEGEIGRDEVVTFSTSCPNCHQTTETNMCMIDIPHFKEVIIMSLDCDCGYKSKEIKGGGSIPAFGTKITLTVKDSRDLSREVLKSDTSGVSIPDLDLELDEGSLGGMYTTVEGLLLKIHDRLVVANPFRIGDSVIKNHTDNDGGSFSGPKDEHIKFNALLTKLKGMAAGGNFPFVVILSDPLSNSFVGPIPEIAIALSRQAENEGSTKCYLEFVDSNMVVEEYIRTSGQNEALGLNDMCTENYLIGEEDCKADSDDSNYFGTDQMEELPDRLRSTSTRGQDHPAEVNSAVFAVPAAFQRGETRREHQMTT